MAIEKRLIPAQDLEIKLAKKNRTGMIHYDDLMATITDIPTVDAAPVVHGQWVYEKGFTAPSGYECSVCRKTRWFYADIQQSFEYCPNCGAKMDGGNEDG